MHGWSVCWLQGRTMSSLSPAAAVSERNRSLDSAFLNNYPDKLVVGDDSDVMLSSVWITMQQASTWPKTDRRTDGKYGSLTPPLLYLLSRWQNCKAVRVGRVLNVTQQKTPFLFTSCLATTTHWSQFGGGHDTSRLCSRARHVHTYASHRAIKRDGAAAYRRDVVIHIVFFLTIIQLLSRCILFLPGWAWNGHTIPYLAMYYNSFTLNFCSTVHSTL